MAGHRTLAFFLGIYVASVLGWTRKAQCKCDRHSNSAQCQIFWDHADTIYVHTRTRKISRRPHCEQTQRATIELFPLFSGEAASERSPFPFLMSQTRFEMFQAGKSAFTT